MPILLSVFVRVSLCRLYGRCGETDVHGGGWSREEGGVVVEFEEDESISAADRVVLVECIVVQVGELLYVQGRVTECLEAAVEKVTNDVSRAWHRALSRRAWQGPNLAVT